MKTNIKRRYQTKHRKKQKAMWKLLLAVTLGGVTAILSPFALDVLQPTYNHFPQAKVIKQVVQAERESYLIPREQNETDRQKVERIAKEKCAEKGLGDFCWKDLVAMAWTESRFDCKAVGDGGKSHGCFQLHLGYHKHITVKEAQSIEFSLSWTLNRLEAKGYPVYRSTAIQLHNGTPNTKATNAYLQAVNNYANSLR